jgi:hypothetical protein
MKSAEWVLVTTGPQVYSVLIATKVTALLLVDIFSTLFLMSSTEIMARSIVYNYSLLFQGVLKRTCTFFTDVVAPLPLIDLG